MSISSLVLPRRKFAVKAYKAKIQSSSVVSRVVQLNVYEEKLSLLRNWKGAKGSEQNRNLCSSVRNSTETWIVHTQSLLWNKNLKHNLI